MGLKRRPSRQRQRHIALLRGINVGGRHLVPMATLRDIALELGCEEVSTYIQSGNLFFAASPEVRSALPSALPAALASRFGYVVPVVLRSRAELEALVAANPFAGHDERELFVGFLADVPASERVARLESDRERVAPDEFVVVGRDVYLRCVTGMARSKLGTGFLDALATPWTVRNWRTTIKLLGLAADPSARQRAAPPGTTEK